MIGQQHLSFQLVDLTEALKYIDRDRYEMYSIDNGKSPYSNRKMPETDCDYSNSENILNRMCNSYSGKGCYLLGTVSLGCFMCLLIESPKFTNTDVDLTNRAFTDHEFLDPALPHQFMSTAKFSLYNAETKGLPSIFSLSDDSYFFKGANIQLPSVLATTTLPNYGNIDLYNKTDLFNNRIVTTPLECLDLYLNTAKEIVRNSDMEENDKNVLLRDLNLLKFGFNDYIPGQSVGPRLSNTDMENYSFNSPLFGDDVKLPINTTGKFDLDILKDLRIDEGYISGMSDYQNLNPPFKLYALLVSIGREGESDACMLHKLCKVGDDIPYTRMEENKINSDYAAVEIIPLPRNRAKVRYTISAVPNGINSISFKANY
jgi:hypothetical protein